LIIWQAQDLNTPFKVPTLFLDNTSQLILDLIGENEDTIKKLKRKYVQIKKIDNISQPFISKYISNLLKEGLISESWKDGIKHFELTDFGLLLVNPPESHLEIQSISKLPSSILLRMFEKSKDEIKKSRLFDELLKRDLSEAQYIDLLKKNLSFDKKEKIFNLISQKLTDSIELNVLYTHFLYSMGKKEEALAVSQKIIEKKPKESRIWKLIGKMTQI